MDIQDFDSIDALDYTTQDDLLRDLDCVGALASRCATNFDGYRTDAAIENRLSKHPISVKESEMAEKTTITRAPGFSLPTISILSSEEVYKSGPVILVFYDRHGSDF